MSNDKPYTCEFCGAPSGKHPSEQDMPPDYCHPEDHESFYEDEEAVYQKRYIPSTIGWEDYHRSKHKLWEYRILYTTPQSQVKVPDGWEFKPLICEGAKGFVISSPRVDGICTSSAVFEDDESLFERALYALLSGN